MVREEHVRARRFRRVDQLLLTVVFRHGSRPARRVQHPEQGAVPFGEAGDGEAGPFRVGLGRTHEHRVADREVCAQDLCGIAPCKRLHRRAEECLVLRKLPCRQCLDESEQHGPLPRVFDVRGPRPVPDLIPRQ